jgi:hypothetical protein
LAGAHRFARGTTHAGLGNTLHHHKHGGNMEHTHEYDCVVCGAHFDSQDDLARHDRENHEPREAIDIHAPAEPMGNDVARRHDPDDRTMS